MAKVKGMAATNYVGKLGPAVFYMRHGVNINRALAAEVANPKTAEQMTQRNRLTNVVRAYQANKAWMELLAYESVPQGRTLYNEFVSQNLPASFVYLTKAEVAAYTSILAPYRFTRGTLPSISGSWADGVTFIASVNVGSLVISPSTTIGQLSQAIIGANSGQWQEGDQLSIIVNQYLPDSLPLVVTVEITLDESDNRLFADKFDKFDVISDEGKLIIQLVGLTSHGRNELGVLLCHSRKQSGNVLVSTQDLVLNVAAQTMYTEYSGPSAQRRARRSYGGLGEPFLNPGDQIPTEETFKVTFTGLGAEYATATGTFTEGGLVTIRCNTPTNYTFEGWGGDITGDSSQNPMTFTITKDMTISCNITRTE